MSFTGGETGQFRILDGGLGGALELREDLNIGSDPLWTARLLHTAPGEIRQAHKSFLLAGADTILTASYQASIPGLREHLKITENEAFNLIKLSVTLAKEASEEVSLTGAGNLSATPLVAGSVGPYGACLHDRSEYTGTYIQSMSVQELQNWHRPRIHALVEAGVDLLAVETIPAQKEAEAVIQLLESDFPHTKAYLTYCCKDGEHTCHGEIFSEAIVPALQSDCFIGVGVNCSAPDHVTSLLRSIQNQPIRKAVIAKPQGGEGYPSAHTFVKEWLSLGATWIGGCCHVYPQGITNIRKEVVKWANKAQETTSG